MASSSPSLLERQPLARPGFRDRNDPVANINENRHSLPDGMVPSGPCSRCTRSQTFSSGFANTTSTSDSGPREVLGRTSH